jgi:hypothetical protein
MARWQRIKAAPANAGRAIWRGIVAVNAALDLDFRDLLLFGGCALLSYGSFLIWEPLAFLVPGAIFVAVSTFGPK